MHNPTAPSSAPLIRIYVLEDEARIREHLCDTIRGESRFVLAGAAGTLSAARDWLRNEHCHFDVLMADVGLPDGSGLELIAECRDLRPEVESMVLSVFGDAENVFNALQAGASGYLLKSDSAEKIVEHILDLMAGGSPLSPTVARLLLNRTRQSSEHNVTLPQAQIDQLSAREISVLRLITLGYSYAEVADQLHVSLHTINAHIRNIYRKLRVNSRSAASNVALRAGLLTPRNR